ncbi:hypothetical protein A2Z00_02555 [Candidatus Gottesmanbacteria bacterium RBG_13_45_10]|uniref:ArnT-like N-terminal domain-containing protein n=1 Tax=Candidatus Gottesmanbacteria bacterium RBG_13_45_10 TaxID=1798370 RepID=A0A1F5ZGA0_9BACT|nr:MAG: hypothetical protein A2Z00_02555 [Candidatus Gottesmanbacteria bacterium RBG_13_45_10]
MTRKILLLLIVVLAMTLRVYQMNHNPPSLSWDEVSIGYNAYSIVKTGKDEHGRFLPLDAFVAYGDYKPPFAIYATAPFVALLGLNELSVRLPSALFGTLTVLLTYFLVQELFWVYMKKAKRDKFSLLVCWIPLFAAALLAISPWHINISRAGFEANIALFFVVLGTYLVLRAQRNSRYWLIAWVPYVVTIYTFNSSRYFAPIFALALCIFFWKNIRTHWKPFAIGIIISAVLLVPITPHLLSKEARLRFAEVNIFTDPSVVTTANERIAREQNSLIAKIVNNRRVGYARSYFIHFFDNLEPNFLFVTGDGNPKFSIRDVGQLYMFEAPFLAIGLFAMFLSFPQTAALLLCWLVAAIIPAATARETPHALRILNSLPTWQIFVAFGILCSLEYLKKKYTQKISLHNVFIIFLMALYGLGITYYLHNYYRHYPKEFSSEWQYGYREALANVAKIQGDYNSIVIGDSIGRPYMYTLFYTKTDPQEFWKTKEDSFDAAGFYHVYGFGKYRFPSSLPSSLEPRTLYVWDAGTAPKGARILNTIRRLDDSPVLDIFDKGAGKI